MSEPYVCDECGMDLTPTPEQLEALRKWGNPLRRSPCLETESGFHRVSREQLDRHAEAAQKDLAEVMGEVDELRPRAYGDGLRIVNVCQRLVSPGKPCLLWEGHPGECR